MSGGTGFQDFVNRSYCCHFALLAALAAVVGGPTQADEPGYLLRYRFQPNQFSHYAVIQKQKIVTQVGEVKQSVRNETSSQKHFAVVSVDENGLATLEPVVDHVKMLAQSDDKEPVTFDSKTDAIPETFRAVGETVGKAMVRMTVDSTGKLVRVVALNDANESIKQAVTILNEPVKPGQESVRDEKDSAFNFLITLPEKSIQIGESWSDRFSVKVTTHSSSLSQRIPMQRTYKLLEVKGDIAVISLRTVVLASVNDPLIQGQLIQRTPAGTIEFDLKRGMILSQTSQISETVVGALGPQSSITAESFVQERISATPEKLSDSNARPIK